MLVLSRKIGEKIVLPECEVTITVLEVAGNKARLGFSAPAKIKVHREEVWRAIQEELPDSLRDQNRGRRPCPLGC